MGETTPKAKGAGMTQEELEQTRKDLQESIDHFLTVTSDLIETINNHFDKVYGRLKDE